MSEKDDIMALSFLVGGAVNDLKQRTTGSDAKNIVGGLEDPKQFVKKMANTNLTGVVQEARHDLVRRMGGNAPKPPQEAVKGAVGAVSSEVKLNVSELNDTLKYTNKILEDIAISINGIFISLTTHQNVESDSDNVEAHPDE